MKILTEAYHIIDKTPPTGIIATIRGHDTWTGSYAAVDYILNSIAKRIPANEHLEVKLKIIFKAGYVPLTFHVNCNDTNVSTHDIAKAHTYFYNGLN
jgi:hypothetical protein